MIDIACARGLSALPFSLFLLLQATGSVYGADLKSYAPQVNVDCPDSLLRVFSASQQSLSGGENDFVSSRQSVVNNAWKDWLGDASQIGYNSDLATSVVNDSKVGIAVSGGSFRASLYGASVLNALDARNQSSKDAGTGGLLQVSSYISALSGGSWMVGSLYSNNFPEIQALVTGSNELSGWMLDKDLFFPDGISLHSDENDAFYDNIKASIEAKQATNTFTSLTDPWARALSYHFLNGTTPDNFYAADSAHGAGQLWSEIVNVPAYSNHEAPFPVIVVNSRPLGKAYENYLALDAPVYEFSPLEFASYDPSLSASINTKYVGSRLSNGSPVNGSSCMQGLDETGFVFGTSSSLFNSIVSQGIGSVTNADWFKRITDLFSDVSDARDTEPDDVANWPNPFYQVKGDGFVDTDRDWLQLIDGGSNGENIPLNPMFVKSRGLDVIVAVDSSANTDDAWPNGESIIYSQNRTSNILKDTHRAFPPAPKTTAEFISTGTNMRPTFLGCDAVSPSDYPLVIYLPNSPPLTGGDPVTNTDTFKLEYSANHVQMFLDQSYRNTIGGFTPGSNNADANFGKCLQCAAVDRARLRADIERSSFCNSCFDRYCYDPNDPPSSNEVVNRNLQNTKPDDVSNSASGGDSDGAMVTSVGWGSVVLAVGITVVSGGLL
ncbi:hypothetical protein CYLTODRAFT_361495 [Cylindrobasidium torrendii FP15055 ss-10]|uniref:Lysophospholipase n=1 Tax=Cylindrobasidium torrendii FP15055 ss-10 TaxID=1314674 RepID=A0A0D7AW41_9AGAR|nr:hypothetical protein CYLTODRAFT_361495 [Cylindrobasidium torrendii FP15055 ss-10]